MSEQPSGQTCHEEPMTFGVEGKASSTLNDRDCVRSSADVQNQNDLNRRRSGKKPSKKTEAEKRIPVPTMYSVEEIPKKVKSMRSTERKGESEITNNVEFLSDGTAEAKNGKMIQFEYHTLQELSFLRASNEKHSLTRRKPADDKVDLRGESISDHHDFSKSSMLVQNKVQRGTSEPRPSSFSRHHEKEINKSVECSCTDLMEGPDFKGKRECPPKISVNTGDNQQEQDLQPVLERNEPDGSSRLQLLGKMLFRIMSLI